MSLVSSVDIVTRLLVERLNLVWFPRERDEKIFRFSKISRRVLLLPPPEFPLWGGPETFLGGWGEKARA
jgi:hypothetical protein